MKIPAEYPIGRGKSAYRGGKEGKETDGETFAQVGSQNVGVNLRSGQKGEQHASAAGEELNQRHRDAELYRAERSRQREAHPEGCDQPDIHLSLRRQSKQKPQPQSFFRQGSSILADG